MTISLRFIKEALLVVAALLSLLPSLSMGAQANGLRLQDVANGGSFVLMMRHADAPGFGDPPGFRQGDCGTQRNLGAAGRAQAQAIGRWLEGQGLRQPRLFASPWCRCLDTARLLGLGPVVSEDSLGSFFDEPSQGGAQTRQLQAFIARTLSQTSTAPLVLVTHQVNITAFVGATVGTGEMVLVEVDTQGKPVRHVRLSVPGER